MASHCLFQRNAREVLKLISTVEKSCPQNTDSAIDSAVSWNSLAADMAASYLAGEALRWYEGLDILHKRVGRYYEQACWKDSPPIMTTQVTKNHASPGITNATS